MTFIQAMNLIHTKISLKMHFQEKWGKLFATRNSGELGTVFWAAGGSICLVLDPQPYLKGPSTNWNNRSTH